MFKRILVPTDGSDISAKATQTAISMAKLLGAALYTISVKEPFPYSAISEMQPTPPQEFFDAQERIAAKRILAWLPDEPARYDKLTAWEYLEFIAGLWGVGAKVQGFVPHPDGLIRVAGVGVQN